MLLEITRRTLLVSSTANPPKRSKIPIVMPPAKIRAFPASRIAPFVDLLDVTTTDANGTQFVALQHHPLVDCYPARRHHRIQGCSRPCSRVRGWIGGDRRGRGLAKMETGDGSHQKGRLGIGAKKRFSRDLAATDGEHPAG